MSKLSRVSLYVTRMPVDCLQNLNIFMHASAEYLEQGFLLAGDLLFFRIGISGISVMAVFLASFATLVNRKFYSSVSHG